MAENKVSVHVVPAEPGWRSIYVDDDVLYVTVTIIAWRIEIHDRGGDNDETYVYPIETSGGADPNYWGCLRPDGKVESLYGWFGSLAEAVDDVKARRVKFGGGKA